jgi:hypothetical protein
MTYQELRSNDVGSGASVYFAGGAADFSAPVYRGFSLFADATGAHATQGGDGNRPLNFVTSVAGPQYRYRIKSLSLFAEGAVGAAYAFSSEFPGSSGSIAAGNGIRTSAKSFAALLGGGLELHLNQRVSLRLVQADWLRTNLPNAAGNAQNQLRLGAGLTLHLF